MKTIIAPTDFSTASLNAVDYAAKLSVATEAELLLVNIIPIPISVAEFPVTGTMFDEMEESTEKELSDLQHKLLLGTNNKASIRTFSEIGTVDYELEELCRQKKPFTVVMNTKDNSAFERFILGSNTLSAMRHIHYPVLIVPEKYSFKTIEKIAIACDLEHPVSHKTIKIIEDWVSSFKASLHIINVNESAGISTNSVANSISLQNQLSYFQPVFHFINKEKIEEGINEVIEKEKPDALIVVPQSHGIFHKSHSKPFVLHSKIPVLTVHEHS